MKISLKEKLQEKENIILELQNKLYNANKNLAENIAQLNFSNIKIKEYADRNLEAEKKIIILEKENMKLEAKLINICKNFEVKFFLNIDKLRFYFIFRILISN